MIILFFHQKSTYPKEDKFESIKVII